MFVPRFNRTKVSPLLFGLRWCFSFSASFFLLTLKVFKLFSYFQIQTKASAVAVAIVVAVWTGWLVVFLNLDWRMSVFHSTCFLEGNQFSQSFRHSFIPPVSDRVNHFVYATNLQYLTMSMIKQSQRMLITKLSMTPLTKLEMSRVRCWMTL